MEEEIKTVSTKKLTLVYWRGMVLPMTPEEYKEFLDRKEEFED